MHSLHTFPRTSMLLSILALVVSGRPCEGLAAVEQASAQPTRSSWEVDWDDPFNNAEMPFSETYFMWIVRQKLSLNAYQMNLSTEMPLSHASRPNRTNLNMEAYLPLFQGERFSSAVGFRHFTSAILAEDIDRKLAHDWFFLAGSYTNDNWRMVLSCEYFTTEADTSFQQSSVGNIIRPMLTVGYALNDRWQLMVLAAFPRTYMLNETSTAPEVGVQMRFQPSHAFKLVMGLPNIVAVEWAVGRMLLGGSLSWAGTFSTEALAFFRFNDRVFAGVHYYGNDNWSDVAYFAQSTYQGGDGTTVFNKLKQYTYSTSIDVGARIYQNVAMILSGGYRIGGRVGLYGDSTLQKEIDGKNEYFLKLAFQYLLYL